MPHAALPDAGGHATLSKSSSSALVVDDDAGVRQSLRLCLDASGARVLARQPDLGVVVVTAFASIESAVDAVKRGPVDYVPKPFTPNQIRLAAQRILEERRLRRRLSERQEELDERESRHEACRRSFVP